MNMLKETIHDLCAAHGTGKPLVAFLGGSRVAWKGKHQLTSSDCDTVVIVDHIDYPMSINNAVLPTGEKLDLIERDLDTLLDEFRRAQIDGNGCVPKLLAESQVIFGDESFAGKIQQAAAQIMAQGPQGYMTSLTKQGLLDDLNRSGEMNDDIRLLAGYQFIHDAATLLAMSKRVWIAKGKILPNTP